MIFDVHGLDLDEKRRDFKYSRLATQIQGQQESG